MSDGPDWEGFGRDLMKDWPTGDIEGSELFETALRNGLVREIPGGYDPEQHIDAECIFPETGDPWYEYAFANERADLPATDAQAMANLKVQALVGALRDMLQHSGAYHPSGVKAVKALAALEADT